MSKLNDLKKEKLKIRNENPLRAKMIGMIIDGAQKIAKTELREVTDEDIGKAAKKMLKETNKAVKVILEKKGTPPAEWEKEIVILDEFIPVVVEEDMPKLDAAPVGVNVPV